MESIGFGFKRTAELFLLINLFRQKSAGLCPKAPRIAIVENVIRFPESGRFDFFYGE
ncbi:hypothetical protein [Citrobacter sp. S-77]|uniref:hypothetical protein n=1 Tax=Citrobacter sp. S-77 TaxID=1080067 RepID=UPI000AA75C6D